MIYLFIMFFILELIVVTMLCCGIMRLDKKVNKLSEEIKTNRHTLKFRLRAIYDVSNRAKLWVKCQKRAFNKNRNNFIRGVARGLLLSIAFFFFSKKTLKKIVLFVDGLLILYDIFTAGCKV